MATTPIRFTAPSGLTLTVDLFSALPDGGDTAIAAGLSATEATNRKREYTFDHVGTETGVLYFTILSGGSPIGSAYVPVFRDDTEVYDAVEDFEEAREAFGEYEESYVWIDNNTGVSGTTPGVNGTRQNPCVDLVDAYAVGNELGIFAFKCVPHSYTGVALELVPLGRTLNLQGAGGGGLVLDINGRYVSIGPGDFGGFISGVREVIFSSIPGGLWSSSGEPRGRDSYYDNLIFGGIGTVESASTTVGNCSFVDTITRLRITLNGTAEIEYYECSFKKISGTPLIIDVNDIIDEGEGPTPLPRSILLNACYGPVRLENMQTANSRIHYLGWGKLVIDRTTCTAGNVVVTTHVAIEDEAGNQYQAINKTFMVGDVTVEVRTQEGLDPNIALIPKVGRTTRHRNINSGAQEDVIFEEVP